jgi:hypothetical protein
MARPILLSFTATLNAVADGTLNQEDLSHAIFFYRCTQAWTCRAPAVEVRWIQFLDHDMDPRVTEKTVELIRDHIREAVSDGRAAWRKLDNREPMDPTEARDTLNRMLRQANLAELAPTLIPENVYDNLSFQAAIEGANNGTEALIRVI